MNEHDQKLAEEFVALWRRMQDRKVELDDKAREALYRNLWDLYE